MRRLLHLHSCFSTGFHLMFFVGSNCSRSLWFFSLTDTVISALSYRARVPFFFLVCSISSRAGFRHLSQYSPGATTRSFAVALPARLLLILSIHLIV
ncbi:hypothetical protein BDV10DRAFT_175211 [Aspergillus recurvatus]